MSKIVKTIQLVTYTSTTTTSTDYVVPSWTRRFKWESAAYGGTVTVYLEARMKSSNASAVAYCALYKSDGTYVTDSAVTITGTSIGRIRSGDIAGNLVDGTDYEIRIKSSAATRTNTTYPSTRLIIIQTGTITATQTDIDLWVRTSTGTAYGQSYSQIFKWDSANWDGTQAIYFEATIISDSTANTIYARLWDETANAAVANSEISTNSATLVRVRSANTISLVDGHTYRAEGKGSSGSTDYVLSATIIIKQTNSPTKGETHYNISNNYGGPAATSYAITHENVYWDEDEWDATKTVWFEASLVAAATSTVYAELTDGTNQISELSTASTSKVGIRSASGITLLDNTIYYVRGKSSTGTSTVDTPTIIIIYSLIVLTTLTIANASHGHTSEAISLTQVHTLAPQDSSHALTSDSPALTQAHTLAVADSAHNHSAEAIVITESYLLAIADTLHALASDSFALTQLHNLIINDSTHSFNSDSLALTQLHNLTVQDALNELTSDEVTLDVSSILVPQDCEHISSCESINLSQLHNLIPDDCTHLHSVDSIILQVIEGIVAIFRPIFRPRRR